jgi:hypothetical protein
MPGLFFACLFIKRLTYYLHQAIHLLHALD